MALKESDAVTITGANGESQLGGRNAVVRVRSRNGVEYELTAEAAMASGLLRDALEARADGKEEDSSAYRSPSIAENPPPFEVQRVGHVALEKVVAFLTHHATEPMGKIPKTPATFEKMVPIEWYRDFCSERSGMNIDVLLEVMRAANYMDVEPLLDLVCAKLACVMHAMNIDELDDVFGLEEMTTEELSAAREDHPWFFSS